MVPQLVEDALRAFPPYGQLVVLRPGIGDPQVNRINRLHHLIGGRSPTQPDFVPSLNQLRVVIEKNVFDPNSVEQAQTLISRLPFPFLRQIVRDRVEIRLQGLNAQELLIDLNSPVVFQDRF